MRNRPCSLPGLCFVRVFKAAFQGWRPFHAHKHPSQDFLDRPPIISDQSVPGTAAVHGLDFFYEGEIDYQQTFCPSPSVKLSGPNNVICSVVVVVLLAGFIVVVLFGEQKESLFIHSYSSFNKYLF